MESVVEERRESKMEESVVCPVCGSVMRLSTAPMLDSADRWGECVSCRSEALVDWTLSGRRVVVSHDGSGRGLEELERLVSSLSEESESGAWRFVSGEEALEEEFVSWPVIAWPAGESCVLVGSVMRDGGGVVAHDITGRMLGRLILWEDPAEVELWVSEVFVEGARIACRRR